MRFVSENKQQLLCLANAGQRAAARAAPGTGACAGWPVFPAKVMRDVLPVVDSTRVAALAATWSRAVRQPACWRHAWGGEAARRVWEPREGCPDVVPEEVENARRTFLLRL